KTGPGSIFGILGPEGIAACAERSGANRDGAAHSWQPCPTNQINRSGGESEGLRPENGGGPRPAGAPRGAVSEAGRRGKRMRGRVIGGRVLTRSVLLAMVLLIAATRWRQAGNRPGPPAPADPPAAPRTADGTTPGLAAPGYKLAIAFYGVRKDPITTAELFFPEGTAYYFASESLEEILIVNPTSARVELLDMNRKIQAEMPFRKLDEKKAALHRAIAATIRKHEEAGGRGNQVAAGMSRS